MAFGLHTISLVLILVCFVFLLLSTISPPLIRLFALGKTLDVVYGTFGYCLEGSNCSKVAYPWDFPIEDNTNNWLLSDSTRTSLNKIVILIPITLGLSFFNLISISVLHFINKLRVISIVLNLLVAMCLTALSAILILIYHPHMGWLTWALLGCAVLSILSFIVLIISAFTSNNNEKDYSDLTSLSNDYIKNDFNEKFSEPRTTTVGLPDSRQNSIDNNYGFKVSGPLSNNGFNNINNNNNMNNRSNTMTNTSSYNAHPPTQSSDFITKPIPANYSNNNSSFYSQNDDKVSVINSVGTPVNSNKQMAPNIVANVATRSSIDNFPGPGYLDDKVRQGNYDHQTPYPNNSISYHQSVFQHHPEVEGHKPFTELDDFDIDDDLEHNQNGLVNNLPFSDSESDFTSVSQQGYNSNHVQYPQAQQHIPTNQQYGQNQMNAVGAPSNQQTSNNRYIALNNGRQLNQGFQQSPIPPPIPQSRSDGLLNDNPDFNIVGPTKRKQTGFVPVAARYKNQFPGGRPGNGSSSHPNSGSGPYSITR